MRKSLLLAFLALSPALAQARLGEPLARLVERFGEPTLVQKEQHLTAAAGRFFDLCDLYVFTQETWKIRVWIVDGRSAKESYSKTGEWTAEHVQTVLTANAQGAQWKETGNPDAAKYIREWRRADGGTASWSPNGMTVTHPAYERNKAKKEAEAKAAAGRAPKI